MQTVWDRQTQSRGELLTALGQWTTQLRMAGIVLAAVVGNWLPGIKIQPIGFNVALGLMALYTWLAHTLATPGGRFGNRVIESYGPDALLIVAVCYFSGGAHSMFRFYLLPIVVIAARHGLIYALSLAGASVGMLALTMIGQETPTPLVEWGLFSLVILVLPLVVSLLVGPRIHTIARYNAQTVARSENEISRLKALNALSRSLIGPLGYDDWVEEAVQRIAALFGADAAWLYDYDEARPGDEQLQLLACMGIEEVMQTEFQRISVHVGITGHAVQSNQIDTLEGPGDERSVLIRDFAFAPPHQFLPFRVAVPLIAHGRCVGVFVLANHADPGRPPEGLELIRTVANQMAIALDNARLYEHERQRRAHALAISEITRTVQLGEKTEEAFARITQELKQIMLADLCQIWLADAEGTQLTLRTSSDPDAEERILNLSDVLLLEAALREGEPRYELQAASDRQFARSLHMHTLVVLPLSGHGGELGIAVIGYQREMYFRPEERELIRSLVEQVAASIDNVLLYQDLRIELHNRSVLYRFMRNLSVSSRHEEVAECFFAEMRQLFPVDYTIILHLNEELEVLETLAADGLTSPQQQQLAGRMLPTRDCWAIKHGKRFNIRVGEQGLRCQHIPVEGRPVPPLYVCVPLNALSQTLGVVQVGFTQPLSEEQLRLLDTLCEQLAVAIHRIGLYQQIQTLADRDPLTEAFNYGYFQRHLKFELVRSKRNRTMLSLLYLDIDHFKHFNDTYGHPVGDQLLKKFTRMLQEDVRAVDLIARMGGEEFAVLLPDTNKQGAMILAEKLRKHVEEAEFLGNTQQPVVHKTVSVGIATYPEDASDGDELIRKADDALYHAKEGGRNQVVPA